MESHLVCDGRPDRDAVTEALGMRPDIGCWNHIDREGEGMVDRTDARRLSEMSLEELWELFPISLVEPKQGWARQYEEMEGRLSDLLKGISGLRISHVGSTAIRGIKAKDIVDILIEVDRSEPLAAIAADLEQSGFIRMSESADRISMNHGYTITGFADEVFHVHLRYQGDDDELYFRDYLNEHPEVAREYEALKCELCAAHEHDRDAYTDAKAAFVHAWTQAAKRAYEGRYDASATSGGA